MRFENTSVYDDNDELLGVICKEDYGTAFRPASGRVPMSTDELRNICSLMDYMEGLE